MKRILMLAALVAGCATGGSHGGDTRREAAVTAPPETARQERSPRTARESVVTSPSTDTRIASAGGAGDRSAAGPARPSKPPQARAAGEARTARAAPPRDEARDPARGDVRDPARRHDARSPGARAFTLDGQVAGVGGTFGRKVRIAREGAEAAELRIVDDTRVLVDGHAGRLDDVREGDEVRATFELRGDTATATELRVRRGAR